MLIVTYVSMLKNFEYFKDMHKTIIKISLLILSVTASNSAISDIKWLPVIATSPETGFQYGALLLQTLEDEAVEGKQSSIQYVAINSTESQQRLVVRPTLYFMDYKLKLSPIVNYSSFPEKFYGLGNDTQDQNEEDFTSDYLYLELTGQYNFYSNWHIELTHSIDDREITDFEDDALVDTLLSNGQLNEYKLKSFGYGLIWDTRNSPRYPDKGIYASVKQEQFDGDSYDYDELTLDLRAFFPIAEKQILATQYLQISQDGDSIPFINLATIGGTDVVRGIFEGRYRAPDMKAAQIEYRKYGYEFFGLDTGFTVFAATGKVDAGNDLPDDDDSLHSAVGFGGHFFFNPEDKTTIRFDLAFSEDESGVYLMIDQAF